VLADDHVVVRSGLRMLLESDPGLDVVGECGDVQGALEAVEGQRPDVLVLDLHMPGESSLAAIPRLRELHPETHVIVLTAQRDPSFAAVATRKPAELSPRELEVLRLIARGNTNREIAERLFLSVRTVESHRARLQRKLELTRRSELVEYALEHGLVEQSDVRG